MKTSQHKVSEDDGCRQWLALQFECSQCDGQITILAVAFSSLMEVKIDGICEKCKAEVIFEEPLSDVFAEMERIFQC